jgi:hypothetical protein
MFQLTLEAQIALAQEAQRRLLAEEARKLA